MINIDLNPEQKEAVEHFGGPCVVTSVPGSGKTRTLTARVVRLIQRGISPKNILCLTFTNKAANEMRERVSQHLGVMSKDIWISTFHALFLAILRKYGNLVGLTSGFSVYNDDDQQSLIEKIARMHEYKSDFKIVRFLSKRANDFRENLEDFDKSVSDLANTERNIIKEYISRRLLYCNIVWNGRVSWN